MRSWGFLWGVRTPSTLPGVDEIGIGQLSIKSYILSLLISFLLFLCFFARVLLLTP